MEAGKIEFAPDYKSEKPEVLFVNDAATMEARKKRARLRDAVIEAALAWSPKRGVHATHHTARVCPTCATERTFHSAVAALESFETEQKKNA